MKVGTTSSELRVATAGVLVLFGAGWVVARESPRPGPEPEPRVLPAPAPAPSAESSAGLRRFGPLTLGEELALGFVIAGITFDSDSIRVQLNAADSRRIVIGVSSKQKKLERPPPVEFPNLSLWYVGRGAVPAEYPELAQALATRFDRAAGSERVSDSLERWKAEARDGG